MKTSFKKSKDSILIQMKGLLSFDDSEPLKENLERIISKSYKDVSTREIIFDFKELEFVGSSGISHFVHTLKKVSKDNNIKPKYYNVKSGFQKIIKLFDEDNDFEFFED